MVQCKLHMKNNGLGSPTPLRHETDIEERNRYNKIVEAKEKFNKHLNASQW